METKKLLERTTERIEDIIKDILKNIDKKGGSTPADLENLSKSVCLIEKINRIEEGYSEDYEGAEGYSERGMSRNSHRMYDEISYPEASYRRGRSPMTGRYVSRDSGGGSSNSSHRYYDGNGSSRGYSGHSMRDRAIAKLEEMYDEATTNHERQWLDEWINRLRD